jgi:hypothetical protein
MGEVDADRRVRDLIGALRRKFNVKKAGLMGDPFVVDSKQFGIREGVTLTIRYL